MVYNLRSARGRARANSAPSAAGSPGSISQDSQGVPNILTSPLTDPSVSANYTRMVSDHVAVIPPFIEREEQSTRNPVEDPIGHAQAVPVAYSNWAEESADLKDEGDDPRPWTTVSYKKNHSLHDNYDSIEPKSPESKLSKESIPQTPVKVAVGTLSTSEQYLIDRRHQDLKIYEPGKRSDSSTDSEEEEHVTPRPDSPGLPYLGKGKGIDPRNWGNISFEEENGNGLVLPQAALASFGTRSQALGPKHFSRDTLPVEEGEWDHTITTVVFRPQIHITGHGGL
ncbi:hypothetical protein CPB85DRAFT_1449043 [Mucidula mucida]|nr:hypothetical protein CPB85DRAFT_1449043 [Mucidula mucida]